MNKRERTLLIVVLALIVGTGGLLRYMKSHQHLGKPGVRAVDVAGSPRMHIQLPTEVTGFDFKENPPDETVTNGLPKDTSFCGGIYEDAEGIIQTMVVMMGTDRTSIHQPQFCLTGQGWTIAQSEVTKVRIDRRSAELPVMKLIAKKTFEKDGKKTAASGVYVYWFVADDAVTAAHKQRMWWMAEHLLRTGELQRWSYVSYFAMCEPGKEDRAFGRIQRLMNRTVPEFQLAWPATLTAANTTR